VGHMFVEYISAPVLLLGGVDTSELDVELLQMVS